MLESCTERFEPERAKRSSKIKFRKNLISWLTRHQALYRIMIPRWRRFKFLFLKSEWTIRGLGVRKDKFLDIRRKLRVSPRDIVFCSLQEFGVSAGLGRVLDGDWDLSEKKFDDLDLVAAVRQLRKGDVSWEKTEFFKNLTRKIESGKVLWGCETREDLLARCRDIERLYESIKNHGYKSSEELDSEGLNWSSRPSLDEVTVSIGRSGQLLFSNSAHRLAIAKVLDIGNIPVQVAVRHPVWMQFRREIGLYAERHGGLISQPAPHPDLDQVPFRHSCADRLKLIRDSMISKKGRLLDIGAKWGYFCHAFEELGFDCFAVEDAPEDSYFLEHLKTVRNRSFRIVAESVLESQVIRDTRFAVILALNTFHHFLKTEASFSRFCSFLKTLKCDEMFLEHPLESETRTLDAQVKLSPERLTTFIAQECGLSQIQLLGQASDSRRLYRLSKIDD